MLNKAKQIIICWGKNSEGQLNIPIELNNSKLTYDYDINKNAHYINTDPKININMDKNINNINYNNNNNNTHSNTSTNSHNISQFSNKSTLFIKMVAGSAHSCALIIDGYVICWGWNHEGQLNLPDNNMLSRGIYRPFYVDIVAGREFNLATISSGQIKCWGRWINGQSLIPKANEKKIKDGLNSKNKSNINKLLE